jgi:hypothetical protein
VARLRKSQRSHPGRGRGVSPAACALAGALPPAGRPLAGLPKPDIERRFAAALQLGDGGAGAHCIHELWMRGEFAVNIEAALAALWSRAAASIPDWLPMRYIEWLPSVYEVALTFSSGRTGRSNVYLVLLDYQDRNRGPHGLYVGMTHYAPAQRFDQHKAGIRAAGSVLRRGLEVLSGPTLHLQHIARAEALRIEAQLAEALRDAGLLVEGGH